MSTLRKLLPVLLTALGSLALAGVAAALESEPAPEAPAGDDVVVDEEDDAPDDEAPEEDEVVEDDATEEEDESSQLEGDHPENHGAFVSQAAHDCPEGKGHGECVRVVAQSDDGKPDHPHEEQDGEDAATGGQAAGGGRGGRG